MGSLLAKLQGKRTYLAGFSLAALGGLGIAHSLGYVGFDAPESVWALLGGLGLAALRAPLGQIVKGVAEVVTIVRELKKLDDAPKP